MSKDIEIKDDRKYTKDHEWAKAEGEEIVVGVSAFAVDQLGDITLINFDVAAGDSVAAGKVFGTIESVKTLSDLYSPVSGKIVAINDALEDSPELVNEDCWGKGWLIKVRVSNDDALDSLLAADGYRTHTEED
jgi:glycine cleavage system H protein